MWVIEAVEVPNKEAEGSHYLPAGSYTISRTEGSPGILCVHQSISRKHAELTIAALDSNQESLPRISLTEFSRYGTVVAGKKLKKGSERVLSDLELPIQLQFGFKHQFALYFTEVKLSILEPTTDAYKDLCSNLGFYWRLGWTPDCTHLLIQDNCPLQAAVAAALIKKIPLVTAGWLEAWMERKTLNDAPPDPAAFRPKLAFRAPGAEAAASLEQKQLESIAAAGNLLAGMSFSVGETVKDQAVWEDMLRAAAADPAGKKTSGSPEEVIVLPEGENETEPGKVWTTTDRLMAAMVQSTRDGLLTRNPEKNKRKLDEPVSDARAGKKAEIGSSNRLLSALMGDSEDEGEDSGEAIVPDTPEQDQDDDDDATDAEEEEELDEARRREGALPHSSDAAAEESPSCQRIPQNGRSKSPCDGWVSRKLNRGGTASASEGSSQVVSMKLIFKQESKSPLSSTTSASSVPNYKAFRRKQELAPSARKLPRLVLMSEKTPGIDTNSFLKAEQDRRERAQAADELFSALPTQKSTLKSRR